MKGKPVSVGSAGPLLLEKGFRLTAAVALTVPASPGPFPALGLAPGRTLSLSLGPWAAGTGQCPAAPAPRAPGATSGICWPSPGPAAPAGQARQECGELRGPGPDSRAALATNERTEGEILLVTVSFRDRK